MYRSLFAYGLVERTQKPPYSVKNPQSMRMLNIRLESAFPTTITNHHPLIAPSTFSRPLCINLHKIALEFWGSRPKAAVPRGTTGTSKSAPMRLSLPAVRTTHGRGRPRSWPHLPPTPDSGPEPLDCGSELGEFRAVLSRVHTSSFDVGQVSGDGERTGLGGVDAELSARCCGLRAGGLDGI